MGFLVSPVQKALSSLIYFLSFFFFLRFFCCFVSCHNMASNDDLKNAFMNFANQGKSGAKVQELDNKNWTKMAKDCGLYNKTCTSTDGDITFQKFCGNKAKQINFDTFCKFIDELSLKFYKGDANAVAKYRELIVRKGAPQNTGANKERFDESGKGKGKEGRENVTANDGYVTGYKGKESYATRTPAKQLIVARGSARDSSDAVVASFVF